MATTKERLDKHGREIAEIRGLLLEGTRMLIQYRDEHRKQIRDIRKALKRLEATVEKFVNSAIAPANGHRQEER
jgi:hypothetical protein